MDRQSYSHVNQGILFNSSSQMSSLSLPEMSHDTGQVIDSGSESEDSYVSVSDLPPPKPPPPFRTARSLPFSSNVLRERKNSLKSVPPVIPPKPSSQSLVYDTLTPAISFSNALPDLSPGLVESPDYEELPDCGNAVVPEVISPPPPPRSKTLTSSLNHLNQISLSPNHPIAPNEEYMANSDEMSLGEFVCQHQNYFPVRIRVSRGFYGTSDQWSISEDEYFNVHFIKKTKVVLAWDSCFGSYNIPLNSSAKFGFLFMPEEDKIRKALKGYVFSTVGDILSAQTLPPIVKARSNSHGKSPEQSIKVGDLLLVQGNKGLLRKTLKCLDIKTGLQKSLHSSCKGNFTTNPNETLLFLPEIIEHFPLPAKFVMQINADEVSSSDQTELSHRVELTNCSIETSLIATQLDRRIGEEETPPVIEIPMDLDITVELVIPLKEEAAQLYEETGKLYGTLDVSLIQTIPSNISSLQRDPTAAEALVTCHQKNKNVGIEIQQPPRYNLKAKEAPIIPQHQYVKHTKVPKSPRSSKTSLQQQVQQPQNSTMLTKIHELESLLDNHSIQLDRIKKQIFQLNKQQEMMLSEHETLKKELSSLSLAIDEGAPHSNKSSSTSLKGGKRLTPNSSLMYKTLDMCTTDEVMKMLRILGLQQYQPVFHLKNIDGKLMSTMKEKDLKKLGVAIEHMAQLMDIIEGVVSPHTVLS